MYEEGTGMVEGGTTGLMIRFLCVQVAKGMMKFFAKAAMKYALGQAEKMCMANVQCAPILTMALKAKMVIDIAAPFLAQLKTSDLKTADAKSVKLDLPLLKKVCAAIPECAKKASDTEAALKAAACSLYVGLMTAQTPRDAAKPGQC